MSNQADIDAAAECIAAALDHLNFDRSGVSRRDTPYRVAKYWASLLRNQGSPSYTQDVHYDPNEQIKLATYPAEEGLVIVKGITFTSACEHHLLPFYGTVDIGYIPSTHIIGLSKFARIVDHLAYRPSTQESLTTAIAKEFQRLLVPKFIGVKLKAAHTCMSCRGVRQQGAETITSHFCPSDQDTTKQEFLAEIR